MNPGRSGWRSGSIKRLSLKRVARHPAPGTRLRSVKHVQALADYAKSPYGLGLHIMDTTPFKATPPAQGWRPHDQWPEGVYRQEPSIEATWDRVALAVSAVETLHHDEWRERFRAILGGFHFVPGRQVLAHAGTSHRAILLDYFAMGLVDDSVSGVFSALREAMLTCQAGGEAGVDFSTLRPAGARVGTQDGIAAGPVPFMAVWRAAAAVLAANPVHLGRLEFTLRCDHPDVESFLAASVNQGEALHCRRTVLLSEAFMRAVEDDGAWSLVFPLGGHPIPDGGEVCMRIWPGASTPQPCLVHRRLPARKVWDQLLAAVHETGEPGVLFIDRINLASNLWYCEQVYASSGGGGVPLPPYGACNLGMLNLPRFVQHPLSDHARFNFGGLKEAVSIAMRFLDNVHDLSLFPLKAQEKADWASRRVGLGVTGLADMLHMLGLTYGSQGSFELTRAIMRAVRDTAYRTSMTTAQEKGAFPEFDKIKFGASPFVLNLSHDLQDSIAQHGMRNSHLLLVTPAESLNVLASKVSSGIAPLASSQTPEISVDAQLQMMEVVQLYVDSTVSMRVQLPPQANPRDIGQVFQRAWALGLKSCSVEQKDSPRLFDH